MTLTDGSSGTGFTPMIPTHDMPEDSRTMDDYDALQAQLYGDGPRGQSYLKDLVQAIQFYASAAGVSVSDQQARDVAVQVHNADPNIYHEYAGYTGTGTGLNTAAIRYYTLGTKEHVGFIDDPAAREQYQKDQAAEAKATASNARAEASAARAEARAVRVEFSQEHAGAISILKKYFGKDRPDNNLVLQVESKGDVAQQEDFVRSMNSHLTVNGKPVPIGQYFDTRSLADKVSQTQYGMNSNDTITQDLLQTGSTSEKEVKFYYEQLPFKPGKGHDVDPTYFNEVYKDVAPVHRAIWNDEPHPEHLAAVASLGGFEAQPKPTPEAQPSA